MKNNSRRDFLKLSAAGAAGLAINACAAGTSEPNESSQGISKDESFEKAEIVSTKNKKPIVISTWNHGLAANQAAWDLLRKDGYALDAVERGVMVTESDPENRSVGYGGRPDRDGHVTLDACIMNEAYDCGSVAFLQDIKNPIAVARKVMEDTPHVMLVGEGAKRFALEKGFKEENLLVEASKKEWEEWLISSQYKPVINIENHDTIGMLALDNQGRLGGACTTSGAAYKLHGRVGDSPIIGAGLYVDGEVGAACATGLGEAVIRACGSHLVVQLLKQGYQPNEACQEAVEHIYKIHKNHDNLQVGFLAMTVDGRVGGYSMYNGFDYAVQDVEGARMVKTESKLQW